MTSPRQAFEENIRPAELLVKVYRLLENDRVHTDGDLVGALRKAVGAGAEEELMLICNEIFLGLIRECAQLPRTMFRRPALDSLLRQAVVASCTALETYLPSLLKVNLPTVIEVRGREFLPQDRELRDFFKALTFSLDETLRVVDDPEAAVFIANKLLGSLKVMYLNSHKGIHVAGSLLGLADPWKQIGGRLHRDPEDLKTTLKSTTDRRNDIVHRADRAQSDPEGEQQSISYSWTLQSVDTIQHVCTALDELVQGCMLTMKARGT